MIHIIFIILFDRMTEYSSNLMILLNDYLKTNKNVDAAFAALADATLKTKLKRDAAEDSAGSATAKVGAGNKGGKAKCC